MKNLTEYQRQAGGDLKIILSICFASAVLYIVFEGYLMEYGKRIENPLFLRFLPVAAIQFGMAGMGMLIVKIRNKEKFKEYGLISHNLVKSLFASFIVSLPTIIFLYLTDSITGFMPFQGMFLTTDILNSSFPLNILGYLLIAVIWGFFEGLNYVVISQKVNERYGSNRHINIGAFVCAVLCILIHGMLGLDLKIILEALTTFILIYGALVIKDKTGNAWGCILIFFVVWNAL